MPSNCSAGVALLQDKQTMSPSAGIGGSIVPQPSQKFGSILEVVFNLTLLELMLCSLFNLIFNLYLNNVAFIHLITHRHVIVIKGKNMI